MDLTNEKIDELAARVVSHVKATNQDMAENIAAMIRKALALAAEPEPAELSHLCGTCKYEKLRSSQEPCSTCGNFCLWEPKPEPVPPEADCLTCAHLTTSKADPPCRDCANAKPMKWEPKPAEPVTPDRKGQWFVLAANPKNWYGPVAGMDKDGDPVGTQSHSDNGPWCIVKHHIADGMYLRTPPPPADAPAGLKGWECRVPVKGADWYAIDGSLMDGAAANRPADNSIVGKGRWIPPKAEPQPDRTGEDWADTSDGEIVSVQRSEDGCHYCNKTIVPAFDEHDVTRGNVAQLGPKPVVLHDGTRLTGKAANTKTCDDDVMWHSWWPNNGGMFKGTMLGLDNNPWRWGVELIPEPQRAWPVGPFEVHGKVGDWTLITGGDGKSVCRAATREYAEAIALSLRLTPECVALLEHGTIADANKRRDNRIAILAAADASGFKFTPET